MKNIVPKYSLLYDWSTGESAYINDGSATLDAIYEGKNVHDLRQTLNNKIAKKLVEKLDDEIEVKYALFAPKDDELVRGVAKDRKSIYLPFALVFKNGMVLVAYGRNKINRKGKKTINYTRDTLIESWYLNNVNITKMIGYSPEQSDNELVDKLAKVINKTHHSKKFNNSPQIKDLKKKLEQIKNRIRDLANKTNRIVALQKEYSNKEYLLEATPTNTGYNQAQEVKQRNREIEEELKALGGEIPKQIVPDLPKAPKSNTKPLYKIILPKDKKDYIKAIVERLNSDFKDIRYRLIYREREFEKPFLNELGQKGIVTIDSISENEIEVIGEDEIIKNRIIEMIIEVSTNHESNYNGYLEEYLSDIKNKKVTTFNEARNRINNILMSKMGKELGLSRIQVNPDMWQKGVGLTANTTGIQSKNEKSALIIKSLMGLMDKYNVKYKDKTIKGYEDKFIHITISSASKSLKNLFYFAENFPEISKSIDFSLLTQEEPQSIKSISTDFAKDLKTFLSLTDSESDLDKADEILERLEAEIETNPSEELTNIFNQMNEHLNTLV